jgi:uncharacterized protein (DUF4415 family)
MSAKSIKKNSASRTNIAKLHKKNDNDINYDDSPETTSKFWENAKVVMPEHKIPLSIRLDEDVINYFKNDGAGYQTRINAVLKAYVIAHPRGKTQV